MVTHPSKTAKGGPASVVVTPTKITEFVVQKQKKARSSRPLFSASFYCGVKLPMNVPQFAFTVRGAFGMYSLPIQMAPFSSETAAE